MSALRKPKAELTLEEAVHDRIEGLSSWLRENAPECATDQTHLDEGAPERAYWHHGYLTALRDLEALLRGERKSLN